MGYKIDITPSADRDLDEIVSYIAGSLGNPSAAILFLDEIDACYRSLQTMPYLYEECHDIRLRELKYRRAVIRNYIMIYRVDEGARVVHILRFFYGARDYEKLI